MPDRNNNNNRDNNNFMQDIIITIEKVNKIFELHEAFNKSKEEASNELSKAMMNANRRVKYKNENLEEKVLWDELRYEGANGPAGKLLKEKYPKVFETSEAQEKAKGIYKETCYIELGINPLAMTLSDIMRLIMGVVDYKLKDLPKGCDILEGKK